jgi:hypothetical protein
MRKILVMCLISFSVRTWAVVEPTATRRFEIRYAATIPALSPDAKSLRVWLPYPQSDHWFTCSTIRSMGTASYISSRKHLYPAGQLSP